MAAPWYPDYPDSWGWTDVTDLEDDVIADHINQVYAEAEAIGKDLLKKRVMLFFEMGGR